MKTSTIYIIITAWLAFLLVSMLTGCRTKTVVEYIEKHDTLRISKTDTCIKVKTEYSHDTLRIETEKVITVSVSGDTLKVVEWRDRWRDRYVAVHDTVKQVKTDTVYVSKEASHDKETVARKKSILKPVFVTAFLALMMALCFILYRKR